MYEVAHQAVKTCIATIFLKTSGPSSYSAREPFPASASASDNSYVVCFVFLLETIQTGLSGADVYYWFVSGYGDTRHLARPFAAAFDVPIMESVVSLIVEFFFAHRIWALGVRWSKWFCLLICLVGQSHASF